MKKTLKIKHFILYLYTQNTHTMKYLIKHFKKGSNLPSFTIIYASSYDQAVDYANNLPSVIHGNVIKVTPIENIIAQTLDVHMELLVKGINDSLSESSLEVNSLGETELYELRSSIRNIINESTIRFIA